MLRQDFKNLGYDHRSVVIDALNTFLLLAKVYPHAAKKLKVWAKPTLVGILVAIILTVLPEPTSAGVTPQADSTPRQLPTIQENIIVGGAPKFRRPVAGAVSQYFSFRHKGIDVPNPTGTVVHPVASGVVEAAGWEANGYGYTVIVRHEDGFSSRYAHLSKILVAAGSKVSLETTLGNVGSTGVATGTHLHLEIYWNGSTVDPEKFLPKI